MTRSRYFCGASVLGVALAMGVVVAPAKAQDAAVTAGSGNQVEEIVVTAQRREQSLQDVPIVVTSVNAQLLQDAGVRDIKDLTVLTPGLMVTSTSNESITTARIRGVGTVGDNPGLESSVGVLIDGVYRPRNGVGFGDLGETQRIEVLKGPQGTLFGKNTSAGVINVLTKPPSFEFGATGEATIGNYDHYGFSGSVTGPLSETLAARLYVATRKRDGFQSVRTGGGPRQADDNNQNFYTGRAQILWKPSDSFSARFIADYSKRNEDCCLGGNIVNGLLSPVVSGVATLTGRAPALQIPLNPDNRVTYANRGTKQELEDKGFQAELNWRSGSMTLTSVTAVREWSTINGQDIDYTTLDLLYREPDGSYGRQFNQFSQEFRLAGETDNLNWLVGGFYAKERLKSGEQQIQGTQLEIYLDQMIRGLSGPGTPTQTGGLAAITGRPLGTNAPPGVSQDDRFKQTSDAYAAFANVSFKVTEAFELTGGLRYTSERKDLDSYYRNARGGFGLNGTNPCSPLAINTAAVLGGSLAAPNVNLARLYAGYFCRGAVDPAYNNLVTNQTKKENKFSGTVKAAYRFNPDLMTYVSYARGYKGGGFNLERVRIATVATNPSGIGLPNLDTSFAPEFVDSYEIGAKTSWFGRSLLFNAALFYQRYENYQLNAFDGVAFTVTTIPKVVSRGVDADIIWRTPLRGLALQGGVTYAETQYADQRPAGPSFALPSAANPTGGGLYRLPGTRISFAPLWSASLAATFEHDMGPVVFRANLTGKYMSSYNTGSDLLPSKVQGELTVLNGRLGLSSPDERWTVEVWGQNLLDTTYYQVAFDGPLQAGQVNAFLGAPRTYGATLRFKY